MAKISINSLGWIVLVILSFVWGASFILIKKSLGHFSPLEVGSGRLLFAYLASLPISLWNLKKLPLSKVPILFFSGMMATVIPTYLFPIAQDNNLSSSITGILNSLTPAFTLVVGLMMFKNSLKIKQLIGLSVAFVGSCLLILSSSQESSTLNFNYYTLLIVLATMLYGINANIIKSYLKDLSSVQIASYTLFFGAPVGILISTIFMPKNLSIDFEFSKELVYLIILGISNTYISYILFNILVKISSPVFASSVTYSIPVVAILFGLLDGESIYLAHYVSFAVIAFGLFLTKQKVDKKTL